MLASHKAFTIDKVLDGFIHQYLLGFHYLHLQALQLEA